MAWQKTRDDLKHERRLTFSFGRSSIPGCPTIEARHEDMPYPLAVVWWTFRDHGTTIEILNSFVFESVRRCGLRTYLNRCLFMSYPSLKRIVIEEGTKDGLKWLKACGYKRNREGSWELRRPKDVK